MANVLEFLPSLEGEEMTFVQSLIKDMDEQKARQFAGVYSSRRKDPQMVLLTCLIGFIAIAGVHRFLLNEIGLGLLYLFTGGLCFIGTIIDLVRYKSLAFEYNAQVAQEVAILVRGMN